MRYFHVIFPVAICTSHPDVRGKAVIYEQPDLVGLAVGDAKRVCLEIALKNAYLAAGAQPKCLAVLEQENGGN